jgi:hypothetical protein
VKSYSRGIQRGAFERLEAADYATNQIAFFWINKGRNMLVECQAKILGHTVVAHAFALVDRPNSTLSSTLTTNSPRVNFGDPGFPDSGLQVHLGNSNSVGIMWNAAVSVPSHGGGTAAFTQTVKANRWRVPDYNGALQEVYTSHGTNAVDSWKGSVEYGGRLVTLTNSALGQLMLPDSPGVYATGLSSRPSYKLVGTEEPFALYLSYRPDGPVTETIWVTLRKLTWEWHGSASKSTNEEWSVSTGADAWAQTFGSESSELPTWTNSVETIEWITQ